MGRKKAQLKKPEKRAMVKREYATVMRVYDALILGGRDLIAEKLHTLEELSLRRKIKRQRRAVMLCGMPAGEHRRPLAT